MARSKKIRWLSGLVGLALAVSGVVVLAGNASSTPQLPAVSPQQLLASMARAALAHGPISGEVTARIDLGIPSLSDQLAQGAPDASTLLTYLSGDHRVRVWHSADGVRLADLVTAGERDLYVSRHDVWAWDSTTFTAYHVGPLPARFGRTAADREAAPAVPGTLLPDPNELAARALHAIDPSTAVSVAQPRRVAGRDAYVLVLQPRTSDTLVGRVEISVDAAPRVPLGVDVFPRGVVRAAVSVDFTSVSFAQIKPSTFDFVPPAGARIVRPSLRSIGAEGQTVAPVPAAAKPEDFVRVLGQGWAEILAVRLPASSTLAQGSRGSSLTSLLPFSGPLFSLRLVDRGDHSWLIGGLVPQDALARVEAKLP